MSTTRVMPPTTAGEIPTLLSWLEFHRSTLAAKCAGLSDEQLRQRAVSPSPLSLLGLVRHMAEVERYWFRRVFAGQDAGGAYNSDDAPEADLREVDAATSAEAFTTWQRECELARRVASEADTLDDTSAWEPNDTPISLRWILLHMTQEYARHNGHADLLRERIDGTTGW